MKEKNSYDIVFWAHGHNEIERYLPIMVGLKKRGIRPLLFFQDYCLEDGICEFQRNIIGRYKLEAVDFSYFMKDKILNLLTLLLKAVKIRFISNKLRGLRSRILKKKINEDFIRNILQGLGHKANVFDLIGLAQYVGYPYGSYYVKKVSDEMDIKSLAVPHGGTVCKFKTPSTDKKINFRHILVPNDYEKELILLKCTDNDAEVIPMGDPRFDTGWEKELKAFSADKVYMYLKKNRPNIVYVCPNLAGFGRKNVDFQSIEDVARAVKRIGNAHLMIKPHPRCRFEDKIHRLIRKVGLKSYVILDDYPLVTYIDSVDLVISTLSSAVNDILPEQYNKLVIYDNFSRGQGLFNIYEGNFNCFNKPQALYEFLKEFFGTKNPDKGAIFDKETKILNFCKVWIGAGGSLDNIVDNYCNYIMGLLKKEN